MTRDIRVLDPASPPASAHELKVSIGKTYGEQSLNNESRYRAFDDLYASQAEFLRNVAIRKFRVPDAEADALVHEVFLDFLKVHDSIADSRRWLLTATCNASRLYWRSQGRDVSIEAESFDRVDPVSANIMDTLPDQLAAWQVFENLDPRCQEILRLRYFDGYSIQEIAARYGLKAKYTQKLVTKALRRAVAQLESKEKKTG